jgi:23S rRNA (guanosine2251-2'-O)-methyltransferase
MENRKYSGVGTKPSFKYKPQERKSTADLVFGVQSVLEALRSEKEIDRVLIQREFSHQEVEKLAEERGVPVQRVPVEKIDRITRKNHQGIIAFVAVVNYAKLSNILANTFEQGKTPLLLVLDHITDVRNFGAIARTAECMGVDALIVPERGGAQINSDAMKTSSGALTYIPVCREVNLIETIDYLQQSGIQVVACTEKAGALLQSADFSVPTAIVMGSEETGISEAIIRRADALVKISMTGNVGSLNVSVATGMVLYEVTRQLAIK